MTGPLDNLAVSVVGFFGAERRPANQALKHDCPDGPPVTGEVVTPARENLGGDVVWCSDGRIGELPARLAPGVDLSAVADCKLNLVEGYRLSVRGNGFWASVGHELLVVGSGMLSLETGRQSKVSQLDVAAAVEKDIVGFDVAR